MLLFPNAKINLGLNIVSKRPDGYHNIETIFYPIPVKDALEIVETEEKDSFCLSGRPLEGEPGNNLVLRALQLLRAQYPVPPLEIHLIKQIPSGAGLGGGSSDAAFMLKAINDYCQLNIGEETLEELAARIGADCPFFIRNKPVFASGIGNIFTPVELSLKGYYLCLVKPDIMVPTPEAYSQVTPRPPVTDLRDIIRMPISTWREQMVNDFEESVCTRHPLIATFKSFFYEQGAVYASMSGSGSAVFGLFTEPPSFVLKDIYPDYFCWEGILS